MLHEAYRMSPDEGQQELESAQVEVRQKQEASVAVNVPAGEANIQVDPVSARRAVSSVFAVLLQAFSLTFVAEWGDRSQMTTFLLASTENVYGVILGGVIGHALCTGIAVIGGRFIAQKISVRTVTLLGGILFLVFAMSALIFGDD
uniref:GDT1 family protein n=1 Tax=Ditylenchus dipsaci TaxID=166011 RepID=A0A915DND5_9BILA